MPGAKHAVDALMPGLGLLQARQFVVSCEHASNRLPRRYGSLGLSPKHLEAHIAWDPGAKEISGAVARVLGCPLHVGRYSRLLVDLNRSLHHPHLMSKESAGIRVPGNVGISREEREERIAHYYKPYRDAVLADIRRRVRNQGRCVHLSVHSFTPRVLEVERRADFAILFDPRRPREKALSLRMADAVRAEGLLVRLNYPYRGVSDGFTTSNRRLFRAYEYIGLEIEVNQKLLRDAWQVRRMAGLFAGIVAELVYEARPLRLGKAG